MPISKLFLRLVMLSIVLFLSLHPTIAQTKNDRKLHGVNGLVRKVELGWLEKSKSGVKRKIDSIKIYNLEGMEVEEISYANSPGQDREPFLRIVTSVQGLILTQKIYDIHKSSGGLPGGIVGGSPSPPPPQRTKEPDGSTLSQAVIKFDTPNNRYEEIWYKRLASSEPIQYKYVYLLNASGMIVEEQVLEGGNIITSKSLHKFNEQNLELEYLELSAKGEVESKNTFSKYKVDSNGNWIERAKLMQYTGGDGKPIKYTIMEYREISYFPSAK